MSYIKDKICKLFLLLLLFSFDLSAQTVTTVGGYPVIDLSALNPLGAVLSSADASARRTQMNQQTPSNTALLGLGSSFSGHNGTWNAKMSIKFQVMRENHTVGAKDWTTAYSQCKSYNGESGGGGQWRLPTQRELLMIRLLHPQLIGKGGFIEFFNQPYWSSTEDSATYAWYMHFDSGHLTSQGKTVRYMFRCVRDL